MSKFFFTLQWKIACMPLENGFVFPLIDFAKYLHNHKSDLFWILQLEK